MMLGTIIFGLILTASSIHARTHPGYSQESSCNVDNSRWMSEVPDSRLLRQLSLPGTHDSLALYGGEQWQCQSMTLEQQLRAGIRALDVRCRHINDTFKIFHQFVDQQTSFEQVLSGVRQFLEQNPSETILMRIKKEWLPENNNRSFERTFVEDFLDKNPELFWTPRESDGSLMDTPLGEVRGRIVILQNFSPKFSLLNHIQMKTEEQYGVKWSSSNCDIQDDYTLLTTWALYAKWIKVRDHLLKTNASLTEIPGHQPGKLFINFLSGSVGVKPYFVASGHTKWGTSGQQQFFGLINMLKSGKKYREFPKRKCLLGGRYCLLNFEGTNTLTHNFLTTHRLKFTGIMFADFPGCGLIQSIIDVNQHHST